MDKLIVERQLVRCALQRVELGKRFRDLLRQLEPRIQGGARLASAVTQSGQGRQQQFFLRIRVRG